MPRRKEPEYEPPDFDLDIGDDLTEEEEEELSEYDYIVDDWDQDYFEDLYDWDEGDYKEVSS